VSEPQGLVQLEGLGKLKIFIYLIGFRTLNLSACSTVPSFYSINELNYVTCVRFQFAVGDLNETKQAKEVHKLILVFSYEH
jgi:hypothetical protein